jgi:N-dimethylarginine dimethylaminohydrolase
MDFGCGSEVGRIKRLLLKHPKDAFIDQTSINLQWRELNYSDAPDFKRALSEYDQFLKLLAHSDLEIDFLPLDTQTGLDSIYVRDSSLSTRQGIILCNMGKKQRAAEAQAVASYCKDIGIPVLGWITGKGRLEGGDVVFLDEKTVAVGNGYRTNGEGIEQLREFTRDFIDTVIEVPLPHWKGPKDVFHLMSIISPIDRDLAVVYSRLMPVRFRNYLLSRGIKLVEVPDGEFATMGINVLAIAPRLCLMIAGNPLTKEMLEREDVEVREYDGKEISVKGAGGPTCLTRPLLRIE